VTDRPSTLDVALDAVDQAFTQVVIQLTKNAIDRTSDGDERSALIRAAAGREKMKNFAVDLFK
jgi:hypothetical protein